MAQPEDDHEWHLDRKVPVAIIVAIVAQTVGATWWAASLAAKVDMIESRVSKTEGRAERAEIDARMYAEKLIRLEESSKAILEQVRVINYRLRVDREPERRDPR